MRLQNGMHPRAAVRTAVFLMVLKDVSIDINGGSCDKITKELSSPKIYEGSVGQRVEIREHDQLQCGQL